MRAKLNPAILLAAVLGVHLFSWPFVAVTQTEGRTLYGGRQILSVLPGGALVLVFVATDCPISNRYLPELAQMQQDFAGKPVQLWVVYPNPGESAAVIRAQLRDDHVQLDALLDPTQQLVALAHAHTTPEAAVFTALDETGRSKAGSSRTGSGKTGSGKMGSGKTGANADSLHEVYRGRIDNRYISFGHEKPQATEHDLANALNAVLAGKPVSPASGHAVGCAILPAPGTANPGQNP